MANGVRGKTPRLMFAIPCGLIALWAAAQPIPGQGMAGGPITIDTVPVPLDPRDPTRTGIQDFTYAGGLWLTSRQTNELHGMSDLEVTAGDTLTAVSDFGTLVTGRLLLDRSARLVGVTDAWLMPLSGLDGRPLIAKSESDAEGLAVLSSGDRLVSFEEEDRIWLYPARGGPPRNAPSPAIPFVFNSAMEALAADPDAGPDAYIVGIEQSAETWLCRLSSPTCRPGDPVTKSAEFGLVALRRLPNASTAALLRAFDAERGSRVTLQILHTGKVVARMDLAAPLTVDNFEGLAAVPRTDGGIRFYLISDDNGRASQRTLLIAFDWRPR